MVDGAAVVGSMSHQWAGEPSVAIDVPWWPLATGARALRIEVLPFEGERTTVDNHIDAGVQVAAARAPVLVFDARPSWSSTFVRRAIEDDARFIVGYRARLAPSLSAGTANGRLDAAALDLAAVVVIGGPDALDLGRCGAARAIRQRAGRHADPARRTRALGSVVAAGSRRVDRASVGDP